MTTLSEKAIARARKQFIKWFRDQGWKPFPFQEKVWDAYLKGESGLVHATTGTGKTYAALGGPFIEALAHGAEDSRKKPQGQIIWLTPLRALATDLAHAVSRPIIETEFNWSVETRTGDTPSSVKTKQGRRLPSILVTTPESLTLLLTRKNGQELLGNVRCVVADEWHELLSTKRGVQTELALARLRRWNPDLQVWGLSATIGNLQEAADVLLGEKGGQSARLIRGETEKEYRISSLIPESMERFPWSGHLGLKQLPQLIEKVEQQGTSLIFTNTRNQSEIWYQSILKAKPEWAGQIALHHGSIGNETRKWVEAGLRAGSLRCVVCTSSLDLGVDFSPVERVFQIGSPKGVARMMQRAGRSGHRPGETSHVICVPTNALELIEIAAARRSIENEEIESRIPLEKPLDVLVQHACTIALGGGFERTELLDEVRQSYTYRNLTEEEWDWILDFVTTGGESLKAYPEYQRIEIDEEGRYVMLDKKRARQHRVSIGTITSEGMLNVKYMNGGRLGMVEESFISKLNRGDLFNFGGKSLEYVTVRDMQVLVKRSKKKATTFPRWLGGRMPFSTELANSFIQELRQFEQGHIDSPEMKAVEEILQLQQDWSELPSADKLLVEQVKSREGHHVFFYPFAGRLVHEGLSALIAHRLSRIEPLSFTISINDYGFELLSPSPAPITPELIPQLFSEESLLEDIVDCMNAAEMAKRRFREIAQISGLVFNGYPGQQRTTKQLQASTGLLFDVFQNYDQANLLLHQAQREVLEQQLEQTRLVQTLRRIKTSRIALHQTPRLTPFAFPLFVDRLRQRLSSEKLQDRIQRMTLSLEKAAG